MSKYPIRELTKGIDLGGYEIGVDLANGPDKTAKSNYCPICYALVLEPGLCECCKLALDQLVEKRLGGVKGAGINIQNLSKS